MAYAVVTSLMTTLEQVLQFNPTLIPENIRGPLDSLYETLIFLQIFLEDIGNRINDQESLTFLEKKIRDAAYKAEDTVDLCLGSIHVANTENDKNNACCKLYDELKQIAKVMDSIQGEVMKFKNDHLHIKEQPATTSLPRRSSRDVLDEEITLVGMEDDFNNIRDQLIGQARELNIVSIVGMGGMGKTTLARQVFSNPSVLFRFDVSSWVTISQEYDAREILINVLSFGTSDVTAVYHDKSYDQLLEQLYRKLKGKRYLIVMDDLWSIEAWDLVKRSLPDDNNGSRIMITTRLLEVADCAGNGCPPHHMPFLNFEDSWTLLSNKVFGKEDCPPQLEEIGKQMAEHCQGLPLSLVVIGGLLSKINRTYEDWKKVAENVVSHVGSTTEHCLAILSLSYNWLPPSLKACFLYTGAFLEDAEIPADKLIRILVAEGFLKTKGDKMLEEVAEESLEDLVSRSLILASRRRANGKLRTCRIHDLLRQLCLKEGKTEKFFNIITKCFDVSSEGMEIERRMCLNPDALNNQNLDLDKGNLNSVRAILCLGESHTFYLDYLCCKIVYSCFQLLRILDVECIRFSSFPGDITQLIHLRYVACTTGTNVPASISNLWNLQTLIVHPVGDELSLPSEIWKMSSLRYIYSGGMYVHAPPKEENILGLQNLETLDSIRAANSNWIEVLTAAPKIKKLGVVIHPDHNEWSKLIDSLIFLADLQKLRIQLAIPSSVEFFQMLPSLLWEVFPTNLKSLTLVGTHLLWKDMTMLGYLPNLEMLRLKYFAIQGTNWNLSEGGFKKLKLLHILMTNLVQWKATSDSLPNLERLVIRHCYKLKEIPAEIGDIPTLKLIELHHCSQAVVTSAEEILEEQQSMGNEILVVRAYNTGVQYFDMGGEEEEEEEEEAAIASTYGSDMTYNQMSNMGNKIAAEVRKGVTSLTHTDEDLLKLLGRQKNRYSDVEEVECLRVITAELRFELRNPQLHEEILAKVRKRAIDTDTNEYLLSLLGHQKDEYSDVEEVEYLRFLAVSLRHEIWNNPTPNLVARDLSRNLSQRSEEKAKQLILEYAASECDQWDTDLASSLSLSSSPGSEDDDITLNDSSSRRHRNSSKKSPFYSKLKKLIGQE